MLPVLAGGTVGSAPVLRGGPRGRAGIPPVCHQRLQSEGCEGRKFFLSKFDNVSGTAVRLVHPDSFLRFYTHLHLDPVVQSSICNNPGLTLNKTYKADYFNKRVLNLAEVYLLLITTTLEQNINLGYNLVFALITGS